MFAKVNVHIEIISATTGKKIKFGYANSISVVTSVQNFTDTAKIIVPRKLSHKGISIVELVRRNDKIIVRAGWEPDLFTLFEGYIITVGTGTPLVLECENKAWELKQIKIEGKVYPKLNLRDFISEWMPNYDVSIADIELGEVKINREANLSEVFNYFIKNYPLRFFFRDNVFYGVLGSSMLLKNEAINTVRIKKGENGNIHQDTLVYTLAEDIKLQIVAKAILRDNTKLEWKEPATIENADVRTFLVPGATTLEELHTYALAQLETYKVDKMTGDVTLLGRPHVRKGDFVHIFDDLFPERNDKKFFVEAVDYNVSTSGGFKQKLKLGMQIK